eukprot:14435331-Ditylum_brightwellii.AAC.1
MICEDDCEGFGCKSYCKTCVRGCERAIVQWEDARAIVHLTLVTPIGPAKRDSVANMDVERVLFHTQSHPQTRPHPRPHPLIPQMRHLASL